MDAEKLLYEFTAAYGYLCHLTARALYEVDEGHALIHQAFNGEGQSARSECVAIRRAFAKSQEALTNCEVRGPDFIGKAREVRRAHSKEWGVDLDAGMPVGIANPSIPQRSVNEQWIIVYKCGSSCKGRQAWADNPCGGEHVYSTAYDVDDCQATVKKAVKQYGTAANIKSVAASERPPKDDGPHQYD